MISQITTARNYSSAETQASISSHSIVLLSISGVEYTGVPAKEEIYSTRSALSSDKIAEVSNFHGAVRSQENVARLEVAGGDPLVDSGP